jgi:hypothetical protein
LADDVVETLTTRWRLSFPGLAEVEDRRRMLMARDGCHPRERGTPVFCSDDR